MPLSTVPSYQYTLNGGPPGFVVSTSADLGKALPIGRDLEIDPLTHDLKLSGGDLQIVKDVAAIRQEVDIRLQFFLGEWFLDTTQGVPYLQNVLVKVPNLAVIRNVLRDAILASAGIGSLSKLDLDFDRSARKLSVTWAATSDLGELIQSELVL